MTNQLVFFDNQSVSEILQHIEIRVKSFLKLRGVDSSVNILLSGGDTPIKVYNGFDGFDIDWSRIHFWLADERCVPIDDEMRSEFVIKKAIGQSIINKSTFHGYGSGNALDMAMNYENNLLGVKIFDLAILGIGEDGHTASLFPGNELGLEAGSGFVFPVYNSPKPPSGRVTLTMNKINESEHVMFLLSGEKKREILKKVINGENLPASKVRGKQTTSIFYFSNQ
ncbi:6-phosphogluconolactonase [Leptospira levettii]|uniref:6-phosphogluconolactonase n=1 Tax=Leptospira levettii TaxID=2023178 RepID=A0AAW5VDE4_9LEPT|nr:6-phosphogluconolactonase [Leptospira levettii]MCW7466203.1 6-phosphogluconolactonase [Leptospira levettii]MCW7512272.1 6-phosphogluconolactonase [Leptospira levettii]MCW7516280.1 6-phosphogluconolactonase [Leptospira levettii]